MNSTKNDPGSSTLVIVSAPSGCGKDTLINRITAGRGDVARSVSATTRKPREGERNGVDYDFVTPAEFDALVREDGFWEWAEYGGNRYGTVKRNVQRLIDAGTPYILLKIEVQGARLLRESGYDVNMIFVLPPSFKTLEKRLRDRSTDGEEDVKKRLAAAVNELRTAPDYDYMIVNDDLDEAVRDLMTAIERGPGSERFRRENMLPVWREVMKDAQV